MVAHANATPSGPLSPRASTREARIREQRVGGRFLPRRMVEPRARMARARAARAARRTGRPALVGHAAGADRERPAWSARRRLPAHGPAARREPRDRRLGGLRAGGAARA